MGAPRVRVRDANYHDLGSSSTTMTAVEYKHFRERVEAALYSKGKRAGLRNLESDDVHLLYSLRPAEPHEDFGEHAESGLCLLTLHTVPR